MPQSAKLFLMRTLPIMLDSLPPDANSTEVTRHGTKVP